MIVWHYEAMTGRIPTTDEVVECSVRAIAMHYAEADSAFVAGSFLRGEGTAHSDIDLVVLYPALPRAYRESFSFEGIPVEAFVHDPETLAWFLEQDRNDGHPALIDMLSEGVLIGARREAGERLKQHAHHLLLSGPPALNADALLRLRYAITDKLEDLEVDRTPAEVLAIGAALYPLLAELILRGNGQWNGSGKWIARLLKKLDGSLATRVDGAFLDLYNGKNAGRILELADEVLARHGGRLFNGYRNDAPAEWRRPWIAAAAE